MEEKAKKNLKIIGLILCMMAISYFVIYVVSPLGQIESKTFSGELVSIKKYAQSGGYDVVLFFNNSGNIEYLVINKYKTGMMVELEGHIDDNVKILYVYNSFFDENEITGYEVFN